MHFGAQVTCTHFLPGAQIEKMLMAIEVYGDKDLKKKKKQNLI